MFVALGAAFVIGLAITVYSAYLGNDYASRRTAYDGAKPCATASVITNCRYQGDARVVHKMMPGADPRVELVFVQLPRVDVIAYLYRSHISQWETWQVGSVLQAELWHGNVTMVAGIQTLDNPDILPEVGPGPALIFGAATLACVASFGWLLLLNLRVRREGTPG